MTLAKAGRLLLLLTVPVLVAAWVWAHPSVADDAPSQCYGRVAAGRIANSVQLPLSGANFSAYSAVGVAAGRTYVHREVAEIVTASYAAVAAKLPAARFVYGESGWARGGRIRPHRTHQNGLSVDFFVPVVDGQGQAAPLPISVANRLGYDLEFDGDGRLGELTIDFAAMAEHLYQLDQAARAQGRALALVIVDNGYLPKLLATPRGPYLKQHLPFMRGTPWVRHDEHYHVDFAIPCLPQDY